MALSLRIKLETDPSQFNLQDSCHLWLLDLDQLSDEVVIQHRDLLSDSELLHVELLKRRQLNVIAIRAFVRKCLSLYSAIPPRALLINTAEKGKPFLANVNVPIKFNLSHCKNIAVLAIALQDEIGVDIESISRNSSQRAIAERYFHPQELAQLATLDDVKHNDYFFRLWTLKEAFFKATGDGISAGLDKAAFHLKGEEIKVVLSPELKTDNDCWQFYQVFISSDFCVALARNCKSEKNIHWFNGTELFHQ